MQRFVQKLSCKDAQRHGRGCPCCVEIPVVQQSCRSVESYSPNTYYHCAGAQGQAATDALLASFGEVLAESLDAGGGDVDITDHAVFKQHARRYEAEFMCDMDDLGEWNSGDTFGLLAGLSLRFHSSVQCMPCIQNVHNCNVGSAQL